MVFEYLDCVLNKHIGLRLGAVVLHNSTDQGHVPVRVYQVLLICLLSWKKKSSGETHLTIRRPS